MRIYAAHNPPILQMVANLSMPTYYRFHFPTWMETHKGLKNCFYPLCPRVTRRVGGMCDDHGKGREGGEGGLGMIAQSFSSGSCPIAQEGPATIRRRLYAIFSPIPVSSHRQGARACRATRMRDRTTLVARAEGAADDRSGERKKRERRTPPQKDTLRMIH